MTFRVFILAFLMAMMLVQIIRRWPNPYSIGMFFVTLLTITTVLGIILTLIFHQRTWCCFCPIGSITNWMGRKKNPENPAKPLSSTVSAMVSTPPELHALSSPIPTCPPFPPSFPKSGHILATSPFSP